MIKLQISKTKQLPGINSIFVSMDAYNQFVIDKIRGLDCRRYDKDTKTWEIPLSKLGWIIKICGSYAIQLVYDKTVENNATIPQTVKYKTEPFSYQKDGIQFGLKHDKFLLADEMGLGKTLQSLLLACCHKELNHTQQCLIICGVNSTKFNWQAEVEKHTHEQCHILGLRYRKNGKAYIGSMQEKIEDINNREEFFLITNIETLRNDKFIKALQKNKRINCIILDEAHKIITPTSQQTKNLLKLKDYDYKIAMTGTPVMNRPLDIYTALKWIDVERSNYSTFKNYYCNTSGFNNTQVSGYRNLQELRKILTTCMLRRKTDEVLDLPELTETVEYVEMNSRQQKIYDDIKEEILDQADLIVNSPNPLVYLLRLRQATGDTSIVSSTIQESCKLDRLDQLVQDIVDNGRKCLIFSNWRTMTDKVVERLNKYNPAVITGEVKDEDRQNSVNRFQNEENCKVCVGTIGAMGTGLTLTAATTAIFLDLPWTYANYAQAYKRCYRIGSVNRVNVINLICKDTIDETIYDIIYRKKSYSDMLVDGQFKIRNKRDLLRLIQ